MVVKSLLRKVREKMKRFVIAGCGARGIFAYAVPIIKKYRDEVLLCGVYDTNKKRATLVSKYTSEDIPVFDSFEKMLEEANPDTVIVTTVDRYHDKYVVAALNAGCDVIVEKPLTTTFKKSLAILEAQRASGKKVAVTFNLRFHDFFIKLKEVVSEGAVGEIYSIHYEWRVDRNHGSSYFRRWHSERENSGSLLVHKSTHHFDIANWILGQDPVSVNAFGTRRYFGKGNGEYEGERCLTCKYKDKCEYYYEMTPTEKELYLECEDEDGYLRDRCIYSDKVDIEDNVSVSVLYSKGAVMSYTFNANSPYEGMRMVINGSKGMIEADNVKKMIRIIDNYGKETLVDLTKKAETGHGNADSEILHNLIFGKENDSLSQMADIRAGMMSIGIGMAANISMKEKRRVMLDEYYKDI
ncbi:MAG: Gfo/Idh/MocA family oxidoreductase [Ruminococcaceae bacterium]|nr:Gfo/Idh/MocA family oxidoreductase [Oscillospiraceae bacterium]